MSLFFVLASRDLEQLLSEEIGLSFLGILVFTVLAYKFVEIKVGSGWFMKNIIVFWHCRHKYLNDIFFRKLIQRNKFTWNILK